MPYMNTAMNVSESIKPKYLWGKYWVRISARFLTNLTFLCFSVSQISAKIVPSNMSRSVVLLDILTSSQFTILYNLGSWIGAVKETDTYC
jgi:hypothetical protein